MTVIIERTDCAGDIKQYDNISSVNDKNTYYELYIHQNWQVRIPKKNHNIIEVR